MEYKDVPYRPVVSEQGTTSNVRDLMTSCWKEDPEKRPSFRMIRDDFRELNKGRYMCKGHVLCLK